MTNRVGFYGDARLQGYDHAGHFEYGPERHGYPVWMAVTIPRELWGRGPSGTSEAERERYRRWDHRHLLPYVQQRPEDKPAGQSRGEGEGDGVAKITHTANYTVLACWDYTGDNRGTSWAMFWVRGKLSANDMVNAIKRDFPRIWARITGPVRMAYIGDVETPPPTYGVEIPNDFFDRALAGQTGTQPQSESLVMTREDLIEASSSNVRRAR